MPSRRALRQVLLRLLFLGLPLSLLLGLAGCGWTPLYADAVSGPGDEELRAIRVAPISERVGQRLAMALRESLNPGNVSTPQRYLLRITLQVVRIDLGVQSQGLGTRGRADIYATYYLTENKTGVQISSGTSHVAESFDILANEYSNVVAEEDSRVRAVEELRRDLVSRLTVIMHYRVAEQPR